MDRELPRDRLLDACGIDKTARPKHDPRQMQEILERAETALAKALQTQELNEQAYQKLKAFFRDQLPLQLVKAHEDVIRELAAKSLRPLDEVVGDTANRIASCGKKLSDFSWNWRLMVLSAFLGFVTVLTGAAVLRFYVFTEEMKEAQRYEVYGRKVQATIEMYKPGDREKLYRLVGGRP